MICVVAMCFMVPCISVLVQDARPYRSFEFIVTVAHMFLFQELGLSGCLVSTWLPFYHNLLIRTQAAVAAETLKTVTGLLSTQIPRVAVCRVHEPGASIPVSEPIICGCNVPECGVCVTNCGYNSESMQGLHALCCVMLT